MLYRISSVEYVPGRAGYRRVKGHRKVDGRSGEPYSLFPGRIRRKIAEGENIRFLFVNLTEITYTSSVLPPLILVALLSKLEKFLNKHLPELIKSLFTPLICLAALVPLTIVVIRPIDPVAVQWSCRRIQSSVSDGASDRRCSCRRGVAGDRNLWHSLGDGSDCNCQFCAERTGHTADFYSDCCNFTDGSCIWSIFKSKRQAAENRCTVRRNHRNFRNYRTGNLWDHTAEKETVYLWLYLGCNRKCNRCGYWEATQYVYAGLPGLISVVNSISVENPGSFPARATGAAVTITGTIGSILLFGCEPKQKENAEHSILGQTVFSPLTGELKSLKDVNDPTFSEEILGKGIAILPKEGIVYAPFDGVVSALFDTKHAIGLTDDQGMELLIHVGLETVNLGGTHFEVHISQGDLVKKGDPLITFDLQEIQKTHDVITPVLITNADDFSEIVVQKEFGPVKAGDAILTVKK